MAALLRHWTLRSIIQSTTAVTYAVPAGASNSDACASLQVVSERNYRGVNNDDGRPFVILQFWTVPGHFCARLQHYLSLEPDNTATATLSELQWLHHTSLELQRSILKQPHCLAGNCHVGIINAATLNKVPIGNRIAQPPALLPIADRADASHAKQFDSNRCLNKPDNLAWSDNSGNENGFRSSAVRAPIAQPFANRSGRREHDNLFKYRTLRNSAIAIACAPLMEPQLELLQYRQRPKR